MGSMQTALPWSNACDALESSMQSGAVVFGDVRLPKWKMMGLIASSLVNDGFNKAL